MEPNCKVCGQQLCFDFTDDFYGERMECRAITKQVFATIYVDNNDLNYCHKSCEHPIFMGKKIFCCHFKCFTENHRRLKECIALFGYGGPSGGIVEE